MKRVLYLLTALLTFAAGSCASVAWQSLRSWLSTPSSSQQMSHVIADQAPLFSGYYENPTIPDGLFHVERGSGGYVMCPFEGYDERALVLSYDGKAIVPKANDPDALTIPGFYLSPGVRLHFERVEVLGRKVYFRTRNVNGVSYEFSGASGEEIINASDPLTPVPFIKGILTKSRDGKLESEEEIKFR